MPPPAAPPPPAPGLARGPPRTASVAVQTDTERDASPPRRPGPGAGPAPRRPGPGGERPARRARSRRSSGSLGSAEACVELVIDEEDVTLIRALLERAPRFLRDVDVRRFDADDRYKRDVFYRINPLVRVARCPRIAALAAAGGRSLRLPAAGPGAAEAQAEALARLRFASQLGLRSVSEAGSSPAPRRTRRARRQVPPAPSGSDTDDTFLPRTIRASPGRPRPAPPEEAPSRKTPSSPKKSDSKRAEANAENIPPNAMPRTTGPVLISRPPRRKQSSVPPGREYSALEDHSIVAWLSADATRERAVNGNRVWRLLQADHARLTGQKRTWHSLRNRYLRYILPALGALALPAAHAQRLRAAAATGELKARKAWRQNSIFRETAVRSASARLPRAPRAAPAAGEAGSEGEAVSPRALRSRASGGTPAPVPRAAPASPVPAQARAHSPLSYSALTRRFALRHRSTPHDASTTEQQESAEGSGSARPALRTRRLYNPGARL